MVHIHRLPGRSHKPDAGRTEARWSHAVSAGPCVMPALAIALAQQGHTINFKAGRWGKSLPLRTLPELSRAPRNTLPPFLTDVCCGPG